MTANYQYPLELSWSADEMSQVIAFWAQVELYYENPSAIRADRFFLAYQAFKKIVPSKAEEKRLDREFQRVSGYSSYRAIQALVKSPKIL